MAKKIVCLDFDDVINNYGSWENEGFVKIKGKPMFGIKKAIKQFKKAGCKVFVHSVRCGYAGGRHAIILYLEKYHIKVDKVFVNKPPADVYVDDKAITFKGKWNKDMIQAILEFKSWGNLTL